MSKKVTIGRDYQGAGREEIKMLFNRKPQPHFAGIEAAIDYIKGYCNKHQNCSECCKLYDTEDGCCVFFDGSAGTPCDWGDLLKRKEENNDEEDKENIRSLWGR